MYLQEQEAMTRRQILVKRQKKFIGLLDKILSNEVNRRPTSFISAHGLSCHGLFV